MNQEDGDFKDTTERAPEDNTSAVEGPAEKSTVEVNQVAPSNDATPEAAAIEGELTLLEAIEGADKPNRRSDNTALFTSTVVQFLSLYLLVLAFFIWLVSLAQFEGVKSLAVINSLKAHFQAVEKEEKKTDLTALVRGKILNSKEFQDVVKGTFSTIIGVEKVDAPTPGRTMRVVMKAASLFENGTTKIRENHIPLVDRLIAALSGRAPGYHFEMEFIVGSESTSPTRRTVSQISNTQSLHMARAGVFVRNMLARGVPPDTVSIGLRKGRPDLVKIYFYIRTPSEVKAYYQQIKNPNPVLPDEMKPQQLIGERVGNGA